MEYKLQSKHKITDLLKVLREYAEVKECGDGIYLVVVEKEQQNNLFLDTMSLFLCYSKFSRSVESYLSRHCKDLKKTKIVMSDILYGFEDNLYYYLLTRIRLVEYFKNNTTLNIEAFLLFNMNEVKKEAEVIVQEDLDFSSINGVKESYKGEDLRSVETKELLADLVYSKNNGKPFKSIDVFYVNGKMRFVDDNKNLIDQQYVFNNIGIILTFNEDDTKQAFYMGDISFLIIIIEIYDVELLRVHTSNMPLNIVKHLKSSLNNCIKAGLPIKLKFCYGCPECIH